MIHRRVSLAPTLVLALLAAGCESDGSGEELEGTRWVLATLVGRPALPSVAVTLELSGGRVRGSAGCNQYGGTYQATDADFRVSALTQTEMACADLSNMEQEALFLRSLGSASAYRLTGNQLELLDPSGGVSLTLTREGAG